MISHALYEAVHDAMVVVLESERLRLAPDVSADEFWPVFKKIQARSPLKPDSPENLFTGLSRQFRVAIARVRARKKGGELEDMWKLSPKEPRVP